jgi:ADP-ribose pyrophosphatase
MSERPGEETLGQGKFLRLVRRDGWEYVERTRPVRSVFIVAVTPQGRLLLTREDRIPVGRTVVGCPAGLVGDVLGEESETLEAGVRRELLEETGFEAAMNGEVIAIMLAEGLRRVAPGGGVEGESIVVHEVPLDHVDAWLRRCVADGLLIDPKVYAGLYFLGRRGTPPPALDA